MDLFVLFMVLTSLLRGRLVSASGYFMPNKAMDWSTAQSYCKNNDGSLIVFDSPQKWTTFKAGPFYQQHLTKATFWTGHRFEPTICDPAGCFTDVNFQWWCTAFPDTCIDPQCVYVKEGVIQQHHCENGHGHEAVCETAVAVSTSTTSTTSATTTTTPLVTSGTSTTMGTTTPLVTSTTSSVTTTTPLVTTATQTTTSMNKMNAEELQDAIWVLRSQLIVRKNDTSRYRRQFISVYESSTVSVVIGSVAIAVVGVVVGGFAVVPDMVNLVASLCT